MKVPAAAMPFPTFSVTLCSWSKVLAFVVILSAISLVFSVTLCFSLKSLAPLATWFAAFWVPWRAVPRSPPPAAAHLLARTMHAPLPALALAQVSPPYDHADITSLMALRVCVDVLGSMVAHGKMGLHKSIIDKPFVPF